MPYCVKHDEQLLMKRFYLLLLLILLLGCSVTVSSGQVSGLYSAEVAVAGQSADQRTEGIIRAFAQMLVKVTGNRQIAQRPELQGDLKLAPRYVQQYRYRLRSEQLTAGADESGRLLLVQFDEDAVQRLLRDRRLPVWGENRPSGLIWLGFEEQGQRRLMRPEGDGLVLDSMLQKADQRGVPMMSPLMDLEDQAGMQVADLWGDFELNIRRVSERYSPDLIITGKLKRLSGSLWRANWHLYHGDRSSSWSDEESSPAALVTAGVEHVSDILAERYAPVAGEGSLSRVRLRVNGVMNLKQYASIGRFLQSQSSVEQADIISAEPDSITYDLRVRGGVQVLAQGLALGGLIEPIPEEPDTSRELIEGVDLYYRVR